MKTLATVLSIIVSLFIFSSSADAQEIFRPYYTQQVLPGLQTAPVFVENRTGGYLKVTFEVNNTLVFVEVNSGHEVPDLMMPVGAAVKVRYARALVLDGGKRKWEKVRYYAYWRENNLGKPVQQGWVFYMNNFFRP